MRRCLGRSASTIALVLAAGHAAYAQGSGSLSYRPPAAGSAPEIRAQLTPRDYTTLSSELAARIDRIGTQAGARFKRGDVLVAFDCAIQRAQLARAQAIVTQTEKTYAINQRLVQLKSIGQLDLDVAKAEVEKAKADFAIADAMVSKCTIVAPFTGVTVDQKAREFQYANPGQALLDVLDDTRLEVELIAPSRWLSWLKIGVDFTLHIDETGKTYAARITRIGGRVDPISQSIKVLGEITQPVPELIAGMSGSVHMTPPQ